MHFILRTRGKYGEGAKQEKFTFVLTLVFIQCVINALFAKIREYRDSNLLRGLLFVFWARGSDLTGRSNFQDPHSLLHFTQPLCSVYKTHGFGSG